MANLDLIFAVIFYGLILIFYFRNKEKFQVQGKIFALYKTKLGIKLMNKLSKISPRFMKFVGLIGVIVGFIGMFFILYILIKGTYNLLFIPTSAPVLAPVLPGVSIPGLPRLSFWHWIITIFIVAVVHEFSHGIFARLYKLKIKSSGFAFLGPILAAFVEPDEKKLVKADKKTQLSIFAAGPFSNILLAIIVLLFLSFVFVPFQTNFIESDGLLVVEVQEESPAEISGLEPGIIIKGINNKIILTQKDFLMEMKKTDQDKVITLNTDKGDFNLKPTLLEGKIKIGVSLSQISKVKEGYSSSLLNVFNWFNMLFLWLWVISLGIGLFNLLPLGPIDGGRMFYTGLLYFIRDEKKVKSFWKYISFLVLVLIIINLLPYLSQLFKWIFSFQAT